MSAFKPSKFQEAVFKFVQYSSGSAIVEAVAGSGKTTTIVHAAHLVPDYKRTIFLAFNKSIAAELASKLPSHVQAKTFHSLSMSAWLRYCGNSRPQVDGSKTNTVFRNNVAQDMAEFKLYSAFVRKLVSLAKQEGVHALVSDDYMVWRNMVTHFDIDPPSDPKRDEQEAMVHGIQLAQRTLIVSNEQGSAVIDFDDMLYLPLLHDVPFFRNDIVFVDEAQDTNGIQIEILKRCLKDNGRVIAVGDPHQAIYGFRGAQSDALDNIRAAFKCETLPLSISYRCAKNVVSEARKVVGHIQPHIDAPDGTVETLSAWTVYDFNAGDVVVCRNAKPLIQLALKMYAARIPATVLGRDIGEGLRTMVMNTGAKTLPVLEDKLDAIWLKARNAADKSGDDSALEALEDKIGCIGAMMRSCAGESTSELLTIMDGVFRQGGGVQLCTIHKSKGLEWGTVYLLDEQLMPSKYAKQDWQLEQEENLRYVAITRAAKCLRYITSK